MVREAWPEAEGLLTFRSSFACFSRVRSSVFETVTIVCIAAVNLRNALVFGVDFICPVDNLLFPSCVARHLEEQLKR